MIPTARAASSTPTWHSWSLGGLAPAPLHHSLARVLKRLKSGWLQIGMHASDRNQDATTYVGNLDPQASEELVWELFVQAGPVGAAATLALPLGALLLLHMPHCAARLFRQQGAAPAGHRQARSHGNSSVLGLPPSHPPTH